MAHTTRIARLVRALTGAAAVLTAACESPSAPHHADIADVPVRITAVTVGTPISILVVQVSAADLPASLVFNLAVVNGVASGTIKIPPGAARTIHVTAVDDQGDVTHEGSATIDVRPGQNPPVQIKLAPKSGQVPISVTFGNFGVVVSPPSATIDVAAKTPLQLAVTVTDVNGQVITAPQIGWATSQPAVATVSASGFVTGLINGSATIVATYEGVAGLSAITVIGGATNEICDGLDNNLDGQVDEGLRYCIAGVPAPHTDGANACEQGFADADQVTSNGCEVQLTTFGGVWSLSPAITTHCAGPFGTLSSDKVTTSIAGSGQLSLLFDVSGVPLMLQAPIDVATGVFGGSGSTTGQFTATVTIAGTFTGPNTLTLSVKFVGIKIQTGSSSDTCNDIDQTVSGNRIAN